MVVLMKYLSTIMCVIITFYTLTLKQLLSDVSVFFVCVWDRETSKYMCAVGLCVVWFLMSLSPLARQVLAVLCECWSHYPKAFSPPDFQRDFVGVEKSFLKFLKCHWFRMESHDKILIFFIFYYGLCRILSKMSHINGPWCTKIGANSYFLLILSQLT